MSKVGFGEKYVWIWPCLFVKCHLSQSAIFTSLILKGWVVCSEGMYPLYRCCSAMQTKSPASSSHPECLVREKEIWTLWKKLFRGNNDHKRMILWKISLGVRLNYSRLDLITPDGISRCTISLSEHQKYCIVCRSDLLSPWCWWWLLHQCFHIMVLVSKRIKPKLHHPCVLL